MHVFLRPNNWNFESRIAPFFLRTRLSDFFATAQGKLDSGCSADTFPFYLESYGSDSGKADLLPLALSAPLSCHMGTSSDIWLTMRLTLGTSLSDPTWPLALAYWCGNPGLFVLTERAKPLFSDLHPSGSITKGCRHSKETDSSDAKRFAIKDFYLGKGTVLIDWPWLRGQRLLENDESLTWCFPFGTALQKHTLVFPLAQADVMVDGADLFMPIWTWTSWSVTPTGTFIIRFFHWGQGNGWGTCFLNGIHSLPIKSLSKLFSLQSTDWSGEVIPTNRDSWWMERQFNESTITWVELSLFLSFCPLIVPLTNTYFISILKRRVVGK